MKHTKYLLLFLSVVFLFSCTAQKEEAEEKPAEFKILTEKFEDFSILRYQVPGFDSLDLQKKKLSYFLYQAALSGRDIFWDQNYKHNIMVRKMLEGVINTYKGNKDSENYAKFLNYAKMVFVSSGVHHPYSRKKILAGFDTQYLDSLITMSDLSMLPLDDETHMSTLKRVLFDPEFDAKSVNKTGEDLISSSATNLYENVTQQEVEAFYGKMKNPNDTTPPMYGLNSKLVKKDGAITEETYKVGGLYSESIEKIVFWLRKAVEVAENDEQKASLEKLITFYETGDLDDFDEYCIAWVKDINSSVDNVNGFIEVYDDPLGLKASYEAVVSIRDEVASERMAALSANAQWFEDNSPIMNEYKKENVTGISYKVITVVVEAGATAPITPIGINLPNSNWIRAEHGSKSVSLGNIKDAYNLASSGGSVDEFYYTEEGRQRAKEYSTLASNMHTALHEVIGHGSGKLAPNVGIPGETLKNYSSALEEARADLVSLYFLTDPKLVELGLIPSIEVGKAEYDGYIKNGLQLQLRRLNEGDIIEQAHMRDRQAISKWVYEKGEADSVIVKIIDNGKTYFEIRDYDKLRILFGELLREIQRIKSEGDFEAGKNLIETYGVQVDQEMLKEVKERYASLKASSYSGFIQPRLVTVEENGEITDVKVEYPEDFIGQMLEYGEIYSYLPVN